MNLLNKLTKMNLKLNKKRTIVTIIGIILSVALISSVATMYSSGIDSLIEFEKYQYGEYHVSYTNVEVPDISKFKNNQKIAEIYLTKNIGYAKIDTKNENKPYAYIKAFTKNSLENLSVKLVEGNLPENETEIVIPTHLKTNGRLTLNIGDTIILDVGKRVSEDYELEQHNPYNYNEEIIDVQTKTYKIVGIIERPNKNIEPYVAPGYTFITYTNESDLTENVDVYAKYTKDGVKNAYKVTANILNIDAELFEKVNKGISISEEELLKYSEELDKAKYQININDYLIDLETDPIKASGVGGLGVVVIIVCAIIVVTSVFCIKNSFDISITEKIKQYGMLRSIGATKKQIRKNVFYEASILGIIGIPLGIMLGFLASFILIIVSNYFLKDMLNNGLKLIFTFSVVPIIAAIILGIITIYFSALRSARKASIVSPIDSVRNSANIKINPKKIKSPKLIKKIFGMGGDISYKNLKRNKKKYRTTVISIIVSTSVFIALASFMNMAFDTIEEELKISEYNISLYIQTYEGDKTFKTALETINLDNIEDYAINRYNSFYIENTKYSKDYLSWINLTEQELGDGYLQVIAIGDYQYKKYIKSLGLNYDEIKDKGILIDYNNIANYNEKKNDYEYKYMRLYDYNKGDIIKGQLEKDREYTFEIGYVTEKKPFGSKNISNDLLIVSDELYDKCSETRSVEFLYKSNDASKLQDDIEKMTTDIHYNLNNMEENVRMMNNLFTLLAIFLYGFIIVISLIGITNIFNTITTNMELRRQEFAMLKSVGMTKKEFSRMIRLESTFMGVKSLIYGLPIGLALSYLIYYFLVKESGMPYKLPLLAIIIVIVVVFLLITTLMKYSMNKINKQNTIETIRNENI